MLSRDLYHVYLRSIAGGTESTLWTVERDPVPIESRLPPEVWTLVLEHVSRSRLPEGPEHQLISSSSLVMTPKLSKLQDSAVGGCAGWC